MSMSLIESFMMGLSTPEILFALSLVFWGFFQFLGQYKRKGRNTIEKHAIWQLQHLTFGAVSMSGFMIFADKILALILTVIVIIIWEIYEQIRFNETRRYPLDTFLDLLSAWFSAGLIFLLL